MPGIVYAGIKLKADNEDERVIVDPKHNDDKCSYGAIHFVVPAEIIHKNSEAHRSKYAEE